MDMGVASLKIDRLTIEACLLVNQMNNFESFNLKNLRFGQRKHNRHQSRVLISHGFRIRLVVASKIDYAIMIM
ncbi:MAG: hypothetical protein DWI24_07120 [Planctomycetota bacterium]|nr:MAG: hypothetical protein DWI24_07120 [Planctomycetota bacterium]